AVRSEASSGIAASGVMENVVSLRWQIGPKGKARVQVDEGPDRSTVYTTGWVAGERRILRADGATRMQYAYDSLGRVIEQTRLDAEGRPLLTQRTERDVYGRPMRLSDIPYQAGRAQTALWRARYRYAEPDPHDSLAVPDPRPLFIATPSVVAGRERRVHLVYNAARQLESVREEGFSPVDEQGQEVPEGVPMSRVMRYR